MNTNLTNQIELTQNAVAAPESAKKDAIKKELVSEPVDMNQLKAQEEIYKIFCNLESGIKTVIHNTDSTSSQAFGSPDEKLKAIVNRLSHVDKGLQKNAASTFDKLLDVISELCDIRINLKTIGAKDTYWGHNFKTTK